MSNFPMLFQHGRLGEMELRNRIIMAPMVTGAYGPDGELTERIAEYYAARARGGVGLIICQASIIMRESRMPGRCSVYDDKFIPSLRLVADAIHENGAKAALQVIHHGRALIGYKHLLERPEEIKPVAPSAIPRLLSAESLEIGNKHVNTSMRLGNLVPPEATREDIERITRGFAEAARRVKEASFDAVEIMGGHGYLIGQFLSPMLNRRTDEYGGSAEKRARFACEVIDAVRGEVGSDFPVILRLSGDDYLPGGISLEQVTQQVPLFVEAGADALHVTAGEPATSERQYPSFLFPQGINVSLASSIKEVTKVPVIVVGKIYDPALAEGILLNGKADFIALGRPLLADPEWANKVREGRLREIRPCIYCLNCMKAVSEHESLIKGITCSVNPGVLREKEFVITRTTLPKRAMVIGGGPAGMQAAISLSARGHKVDLYEKSSELGGKLLVASRQKQKRKDFTRFLLYLRRSVKKPGIRIHLNITVTPQFINQMRPDIIVFAVGAEPVKPNIPGADGRNVVQAIDVILGRINVGKRIIIVGGRSLGMEIADQLATYGRKVGIVTRRELGRNMERSVFLALRNRLISKGVCLFPHSPVVEITEQGLYAVYGNELVFMQADTVVLSTGMQSKSAFPDSLQRIDCEVYKIGDCVEARGIEPAIREAAEVARRI